MFTLQKHLNSVLVHVINIYVTFKFIVNFREDFFLYFRIFTFIKIFISITGCSYTSWSLIFAKFSILIKNLGIFLWLRHRLSFYFHVADIKFHRSFMVIANKDEHTIIKTEMSWLILNYIYRCLNQLCRQENWPVISQQWCRMMSFRIKYTPE